MRERGHISQLCPEKGLPILAQFLIFPLGLRTPVLFPDAEVYNEIPIGGLFFKVPKTNQLLNIPPKPEYW